MNETLILPFPLRKHAPRQTVVYAAQGENGMARTKKLTLFGTVLGSLLRHSHRSLDKIMRVKSLLFQMLTHKKNNGPDLQEVLHFIRIVGAIIFK